MKRYLLPLLLLASPALAQAPDQKPEMVLLPRMVAEAAAQWIHEPNPNNAWKLGEVLVACINDNPRDGLLRRMGADQCPTVTQALADQASQLAVVTKERDELKAKAETSGTVNLTPSGATPK